MATQMGIQFLLQIVLPAFLIAELLRTRYTTRWEWLGTVCLFGLVLLFAVLTARWDEFSYYLRLVLPVAFMAASYVAYRRVGSGPPSTAEQPSWMGRAVHGVLIVAGGPQRSRPERVFLPRRGCCLGLSTERGRVLRRRRGQQSVGQQPQCVSAPGLRCGYPSSQPAWEPSTWPVAGAFEPICHLWRFYSSGRSPCVSAGVRAPIQQLESAGQAKLEIKKDPVRKRGGIYFQPVHRTHRACCRRAC